MLQAASGKSNSKKLSSLNSTIVEEDEAKWDSTYNQADNIGLPDVCKSDLQNSNSSQESQEPDIVRSSSSSSSSSSSDRLCRPLEKHSKPSTVSSFSSSDESATFSDSTRRHIHGSSSKLKRQPLVSQNSGDNDVFEPTPTTALANNGNNPEPQYNALSEKGQRARSDFCSSGYGTGSGENSTSKTSAQLSADLDNELTAVTSEIYPEDLQNNVSNTSTVGSTLPADNIENISSKHNQSNNITRNATKASNTCSDQNSASLMDNAIKPHSLPSVLIDSANPGAISRASLSDHLGKTSSNLSNSSPNSTGSYFITPSNEAALPVHSSISSWLIRQMCPSGPGSQPPESQNIDSLKFSLSQLKKKSEASLTTLVSDCGSCAIDLLLEKLERTARCEEVQCDDENCSQIKKCINELKNCNLEVSSLSGDQRNLLLQMVLHYERCSLPRCPFTWCGTSAVDAFSQEEKIENMLKRVENFTDNQIIFRTSPLKYMERSSKISFSVIPQEKVHWQRLCMVENSSKVLLAGRINPYLPETSYWIIKKVAYNDNEESLWQICSKLRQMNCSHVVKLLWAASFEDHLLICSEYEGYHSLQESLQANSSNGLDIGLVHTIMLQLTDAAYHLHLQNVIYLNWASSNIVRTHQTDHRIAVKLCNFTTSALADTYDVGYLRLALPTYLLPPELCMMDKVVPESDVWGLGCILYELLTGHPIWHAHRHLSPDDLITMMKERFQQVIPGEELNGVNLANMCPSLKSIFKSCWNVEPEGRKSVLEIQILLVESFLQSNQNTLTA